MNNEIKFYDDRFVRTLCPLIQQDITPTIGMLVTPAYVSYNIFTIIGITQDEIIGCNINRHTNIETFSTDGVLIIPNIEWFITRPNFAGLNLKSGYLRSPYYIASFTDNANYKATEEHANPLLALILSYLKAKD